MATCTMDDNAGRCSIGAGSSAETGVFHACFAHVLTPNKVCPHRQGGEFVPPQHQLVQNDIEFHLNGFQLIINGALFFVVVEISIPIMTLSSWPESTSRPLVWVSWFMVNLGKLEYATFN
ncbi:hypothetical protein MRX96_003410 [Rhipicephalus microplus]